MKARIAGLAVAALVLVSGSSIAQTGPAAPSKPLGPGGIRVVTRVPEPDNWIEQKNAAGTQRVYKCKPLACPDQETVSFVFSKSPTRHPNPEALEKFAKVDLPKSIRAAAAARGVLSDGAEKVETLVSTTATYKGYPSVINESTLTRGASLSYVHTAIIFAGPMMIRIQSSSPNQELAHKTLDRFIDSMQIEEGPSPSSPKPAPQPGAQSL
jgi:hypothetical protein